jgi:spoIIIJ-associated protein
MKKIVFEARDEKEALEKAALELRVNPSYITLNSTEKKAMLGLKKTTEYTATVDVNPLDLGYQFLEDTLKHMEIDAKIEAQYDTENESYEFVIKSEENPLLIGKLGKTLNGFQTYLRNLINLYSDENARIMLDIGDYKSNRNRQLEILATKTAKEVARTKIPATIKDLNAYERRIVHTKLSEWRDITTVSEGERPNRYLVIKPKE